jgi:hypothetical protein
MAISIYFNILLRFLISLFNIVFIGAISSEGGPEDDGDPEDDDPEDGGHPEDEGDKTPTNDKGSGDESTPREIVNDITDMTNTLKNIEKALSGEKIDKKDLEYIKEEYDSFFDEDSGTDSDQQGLEQVKEYLKQELEAETHKAELDGIHLKEMLEKLKLTSDKKSSEEPTVPGNKEVNKNETSSPLDHVLEKQSLEPLNPFDPFDD